MDDASSFPKSGPTVLQVVPELQTGGAEKTAVDIGHALVQRGWNSLVASAGGRLVPELEKGGSRHITLPLASKNPLTIWRNVARLTALINSHKVDIIHARSRSPAWSAMWAARRTGIAFVTTYHGAYNQKSALKTWYNSVMGRADAIIANSRWTADLVARRHPDAVDRITPIGRGTDFDAFRPDAIDTARKNRIRQQWGLPEIAAPEEVIILLLGRLTALKGHRTLIEAAALIAPDYPDCRFIFAGEDQGRSGYSASLQAQIEAAGLADTVLMPGHCDDPAAAMAVADIVVSASTQAETFGRTVVEAAALEKPVIVTRIGAVVETVLAEPEVAEEHITGWKVTPGDAPNMADALRAVLSLSASERHAVGKRARAYVMEHFSLQQMCDKTLSVYESVLNRVHS